MTVLDHAEGLPLHDRKTLIADLMMRAARQPWPGGHAALDDLIGSFEHGDVRTGLSAYCGLVGIDPPADESHVVTLPAALAEVGRRLAGQIGRAVRRARRRR